MGSFYSRRAADSPILAACSTYLPSSGKSAHDGPRFGSSEPQRGVAKRPLSVQTHLMSGITHIMSDNPLTSLFASRTLVRLLSVLLLNPERSYYQQELASITGGALRPLQLALDKLTRADLVSKKPVGKHAYYRIVATHPAYPDLRALFEMTFALADVVRDALEPLAERLDVAFIYGSVARGNERAASDVDVLVVGDPGRKELSRALEPAQGRLNREINVTIYNAEGLAMAMHEANPFLQEVLSKPKIWVIGDENEFERLVG